jgi:AraC-like DNA-binding protein
MTSRPAIGVLDHGQREREGRRAEANREELVERIGRAIRQDGTVEPLSGLHLKRVSLPTEPLHGVSIPSFCVIAQGSKEVYLGEDYYRYDPGHYLVATAELPIVIQIGEASNERPHLSLRLDLTPSVVGSVMVEAGLPAPRGLANAKAIDVSPLDASLLDAVVRLVRLLDTPADAQMLMPLVTREVVYRLLIGTQADRLRHLVRLGGATNRVATAIERLRRDYDKPLRIESLARELGMSVSGFHAQFKAVTAMSPLQFQKQVRLQEARRLIFGEDLDATTAGRRVGYDDASYFNREYKSLFGAPPMRDLQRLRAVATSSADL